MPEYLLVNGLKETDNEGVERFKYVPPEILSKFPTPAIYTVNGFDYAVFGVRPSNPDDYTISDLEALEAAEVPITQEEFDARVQGYLELGDNDLLVYLSYEQAHKLYDIFKPVNDEV